MGKKRIILTICLCIGLYSSFCYTQQCPTMTSPLDGDINVPVGNLIQWTPVDGVIGYFCGIFWKRAFFK